MSLIDSLVDAQAVAAGWPKPEREVRFAPPRKFRFDYGWWGSPERPYRLALEVDGGLFIRGGGRHNRGASMLKDFEKLNIAATLGWRVIRMAPHQVKSGELTKWLRGFDATY